MSTSCTTVAVLGDGGWGTTLAIHLHRLGHRVRWWGAFPDYLRVIARRRVNVKYLPGVPIPRSLPIVTNLQDAVGSARVIVVAVPSQHMRAVARRLPRVRGAVIVSAAKGLERGTLKRMTQVIAEEVRPEAVAALSGPNIAAEIARGYPASSVIAAKSRPLAAELQRLMSSDRLRLYTSSDVAGVELGGALKNPIAIAAGISDGLGLGNNAKAALVTRGVVEMARLGEALGARPETFWGLSGLGDLVTTCLSGRNRWLGEQLGEGRSLNEVLGSTPMVLEGVETVKAVVALAHRHRTELPIMEQVYAVLFRRRPPRQALQALMRRSEKAESPAG